MDESKKVSMRTKIFYGCGAGGGNVVSTILATFLLSYYTDSALLGAAAVSTMFFLSRIFDGVTDIIMGGIVDKTHTKLGKARPWLLVAAPLMAIGLVLLMNVPMNLSQGGKLVYAYITYIFMNCIAYTIFCIAHTALLSRMTMNFNDRATISSVSFIINSIVGAFVGTIAIKLVMTYGWTVTSIILGVLSCALILVAFFGVKEKIGLDEGMDVIKVDNTPMKEAVPAVLKNKYFYGIILISAFTLIMNANAIASMIFYCKDVLKNPGYMAMLMSVGQIPGIVANCFVPALAHKYGKRNVMLTGAVILIISFVICGCAGTNTSLILFGTILRGVGVGPIFAGVYAFGADVVDYGEWKFGIRSEGLINSSNSFGAKIGIGIGSGVTGWVIGVAGYNGALKVQSAAAVAAIKFSFGWLGAILSAFLFVTIMFMNVEKYMPQIQKELIERHQAK